VEIARGRKNKARGDRLRADGRVHGERAGSPRRPRESACAEPSAPPARLSGACSGLHNNLEEEEAEEKEEEEDEEVEEEELLVTD